MGLLLFEVQWLRSMGWFAMFFMSIGWLKKPKDRLKNGNSKSLYLFKKS
jgi:hypothetical protein